MNTTDLKIHYDSNLCHRFFAETSIVGMNNDDIYLPIRRVIIDLNKIESVENLSGTSSVLIKTLNHKFLISPRGDESTFLETIKQINKDNAVYIDKSGSETFVRDPTQIPPKKQKFYMNEERDCWVCQSNVLNPLNEFNQYVEDIESKL